MSRISIARLSSRLLERWYGRELASPASLAAIDVLRACGNAGDGRSRRSRGSA